MIIAISPGKEDEAGIRGGGLALPTGETDTWTHPHRGGCRAYGGWKLWHPAARHARQEAKGR